MDLRITVFARNVSHIDNAVTRAGIVPFVALVHFRNAVTPCIMELPGVCIYDIVV